MYSSRQSAGYDTDRENDMIRKHYVDVQAVMKKDGSIQPLAVYWPNGDGIPVCFAIERILDQSAGSRISAAGSVGKHYIVLIRGQRRKLYLEKNRWFIESLKG